MRSLCFLALVLLAAVAPDSARAIANLGTRTLDCECDFDGGGLAHCKAETGERFLFEGPGTAPMRLWTELHVLGAYQYGGITETASATNDVTGLLEMAAEERARATFGTSLDLVFEPPEGYVVISLPEPGACAGGAAALAALLARRRVATPRRRRPSARAAS